jgi:hypothetical protein
MMAIGAVAPADAVAIPGSGPHETVDITLTTRQVNTSAGLTYAATYRNPSDPGADPPALRRITIVGPQGTRGDTFVPGQCTASDTQLKAQGESACPADSRVGSGWVKTKGATGVTTLDTTIFNAAFEQVELVKVGAGGIAVARSSIHGVTFDGLVPTCLTGGQPPDGCPSDQFVLLSQSLSTAPVGKGRHAYLTTPPVCPPAGRFRTLVTLYYADGAKETVVSRQPCTRLGLGASDRNGRAHGRCVASRVSARLTGRDLREISRVDFFLDGRRIAQDTRAPFRVGLSLPRGSRHRLRGAVYAHGVGIQAVHRAITVCS